MEPCPPASQLSDSPIIWKINKFCYIAILMGVVLKELPLWINESGFLSGSLLALS